MASSFTCAAVSCVAAVMENIRANSIKKTVLQDFVWVKLDFVEI
jgi:hypothetical protein